MEPRNRFKGINSASLSSMAGRYDKPIPSRFQAPIDCLKIPALFESAFRPRHILIQDRNRGRATSWIGVEDGVKPWTTDLLLFPFQIKFAAPFSAIYLKYLQTRFAGQPGEHPRVRPQRLLARPPQVLHLCQLHCRAHQSQGDRHQGTVYWIRRKIKRRILKIYY